MSAQWITGGEILDILKIREERHWLVVEIEGAVAGIDSRGGHANAWTYPLHND